VELTDHDKELDRRNFLKCMAWVGTGAVWTLSSGVLKGTALGQSGAMRNMATHASGLRFVQISDSHIGFDKAANTDVTGTLRAAIAKIKAESRCVSTSATKAESTVEEGGIESVGDSAGPWDPARAPGRGV
jgi:hypothetical protein